MLKQLLRTKHPLAVTSEAGEFELHRTLGPWGLTAIGIGAVIGGGIFAMTGHAAAEHTGPAIMLSFVLAAVCCTFCALCYAEFAAMVPVSGSAYSYAYATLGEGAAWFIGWMLILEYGISASAVAASFTGYLKSFLDHLGLHLPAIIANAPLDTHFHTTGAIINLPAVGIVLALTGLCYVGIRESAGVNTAMVVLKVLLLIVVIALGCRYVDTSLWQPFIPPNQGGDAFGWPGVLRGAAIMFFAYIGFEATSVAAQESINPKRDLPIGMLASLAICTVIYIAIAAVMTGLLSYTQLGTDEAVVTAISAHPALAGLRWLVEIGALIGLSSVILCMVIGQPRIFMIMANDGLLPHVFTRIHPKYRTPHINTLITGAGIAVAAGIFPLDVLGDLTSIGTLISFAAVCAGVWILRVTHPESPRSFRIPLAPLVCLLGIVSCLILLGVTFYFGAYNFRLTLIWTLIGVVLYFAYGYRHSRLRNI
ncbi:MAG: amino acid permease [Rhodanobacter sp.]|nr:amino acid permease [Rhodanobacter sp.]